ncbi:cytokine receptor family member B12 isoform X2 [Brachyhypopomus gauderio]|uniref:cytokine receptor family member B12 isoform X2 n=1 Tax=Brachyhypopomus gauderio TaxID=698409 RepID=UPI00404354B3
MPYCASSVLALLLNYLVSSEGALSAPLNLTLDLLDFLAFAHWLPGPDNPTGTRYSLEFIDAENYSKTDGIHRWNPLENCTNITSTHCNFTLHHLWTLYLIRVRAEWEHQSSNWTLRPSTFQLYDGSRLSAPHLEVTSDQYSIFIQLSHPVQRLKVVPLQFSLDLYQVISNNPVQVQQRFWISDLLMHIAQNTSTESSNRFSDLPPGSYCINASAFYMQMYQRSNHNTTRCISLAEAHTGRVEYILGVGCAVLLMVWTAITLSVTCHYVKPRSNVYNTPKDLYITEKTVTTLTVTPDECHTLSVPTANSDAGEDVDDSSSTDSVVYLARRDTGHASNPEVVCFVHKANNTENGLCYNSDLYRMAVKTEDPQGDLYQQDPYGCLPEGPEGKGSEQDPYGCPTVAPVQFSSIITSNITRVFFDKGSRAIWTESPLSDQPGVHPDESPETNYQSEGTEPAEGLTDSLYPGFGSGNSPGYEARPDPNMVLFCK